MKQVVRCSNCENAALKPHVGFAGADELICTQRSGTVDQYDGCTFGSQRKPGVDVSNYEVNIEAFAAVKGW